MNASQMIALLEKQLKLKPSAKIAHHPREYPANHPIKPKQADTCPRCHVGMVFTLESGTRYCLNCGELD